jgi:hypothetical protein
MSLLWINVSVAIVYLVTFIFQLQVAGEYFQWASWVFLPHGVRLIAYFMFRWNGLPGLFVGHAIGGYLWLDDFFDHLGIYLLASLVGTLVVPVTHMLLRTLNQDVLLPLARGVVHWTGLWWLAVLSGLINGFLTVTVYSSLITDGHVQLSMKYMVGDVLGASAFVLGLMLVFRLHRLYTQRAHLQE